MHISWINRMKVEECMKMLMEQCIMMLNLNPKYKGCDIFDNYAPPSTLALLRCLPLTRCSPFFFIRDTMKLRHTCH